MVAWLREEKHGTVAGGFARICRAYGGSARPLAKRRGDGSNGSAVAYRGYWRASPRAVTRAHGLAKRVACVEWGETPGLRQNPFRHVLVHPLLHTHCRHDFGGSRVLIQAGLCEIDTRRPLSASNWIECNPEQSRDRVLNCFKFVENGGLTIDHMYLQCFNVNVSG